jgi:hypothetical protein
MLTSIATCAALQAIKSRYSHSKTRTLLQRFNTTVVSVLSVIVFLYFVVISYVVRAEAWTAINPSASKVARPGPSESVISRH